MTESAWRWVHTLGRRLSPFWVAAIVMSAVLYHNAWLGDDPYITYRSIDNFLNGYGLRWNPTERVQSFTDPLWALLLTAFYAVTREAHYTTIAVSLVIDLALVAVVFRATKTTPWRFYLVMALLVSSKAFIDYSTSGLENPLSHLLACAFFVPYIFSAPGSSASSADGDDPARATFRECLRATGLVALAFITRADTVLVYAPLLVWILGRSVRRFPRQTTAAVFLGGIPALAWHAFAVVYYGFPFPNTAYSKLNGGQISVPFFHRHGLLYFANNFAWDPATLVIVGGGGIAGFLALRSSRARVAEVLTATGAVLYLLYVVRIGGDYMSGRFFALPLLLATLLVARATPTARWAWVVAAGALLFSLTGPRPPVLAHWRYERDGALPMEATGIRDERGDYHRVSLLGTFSHKDFDVGIRRTHQPSALERAVPPVLVWGAIGYYGFRSGPHIHTIDFIGLSDALIARLPAPHVMERWGRGHLVRALPEGYIESIETGDNLLVDPRLHALYEDLHLVLSGPLFSRERFAAIWRLNTGRYTAALRSYAVNPSQAGE